MSTKDKSGIETLPFIGTRMKDEPGQSPRHFWRVKPTGDYGTDCRTGVKLALHYLAYEEADCGKPGGGATILALIVSDMPQEHSGIEVGFLQMVAFAATAGAYQARRISAFWDRCDLEGGAS